MTASSAPPLSRCLTTVIAPTGSSSDAASGNFSSRSRLPDATPTASTARHTAREPPPAVATVRPMGSYSTASGNNSSAYGVQQHGEWLNLAPQLASSATPAAPTARHTAREPPPAVATVRPWALQHGERQQQFGRWLQQHGEWRSLAPQLAVVQQRERPANTARAVRRESYRPRPLATVQAMGSSARERQQQFGLWLQQHGEWRI